MQPTVSIPRLCAPNRLPPRFRGRLAAAAAVALVAGGCIAPRAAVRDADKTAYQIIGEKQQSGLGKVEPFTIERPEDELRRRLMLDQHLPAGGAASYGRPYLPPVPKEPAEVSANLSLPQEAIVVGTGQPKTRGVGTETLATDVFLVDVGRNPEAGVVPGGAPKTVTFGPPAPDATPPEPLVLTLMDALQIAALNSRDYQGEKEQVFLAALDLDLERDQFEFRFSGTLDAQIASELEGDDTTGVVVSPALGVNKLFKSGALLTTRIGIDLAKLLSGNRAESFGTFADASITVPLLRGSGVEVVTEDLQQAEREAIYAIWDFETFKREFTVSIIAEYLRVLGDLKSIENSEANYASSLDAALRAARLYEEGRLPGIQVSQATQNALQAQERLLLARQSYESSLDSFKLTLGLPPDARVALDPAELEKLIPLAEEVLGPAAIDMPSLSRRAVTRPTTQPTTQPTTGLFTETETRPATGPEIDLPELVDPTTAATQPTTQPEMPAPMDPNSLPPSMVRQSEEEEAAETQYYADLTRRGIEIALQNRLDLAISYGTVVDAQRQTVLAADGLKAGLDLSADAGWGGGRGALSGDQPDVGLRLADGSYGGGLALDLPIEATGPRNGFRISLINLDRAIRATQELEDRVKLDVLNGIRDLRVSAEDLRIQAISIQVAERQVAAANAFFELGRGEIRDLTEAQDDLINAQNSFINSLVDYRVTQLELQRDLGVLEVDATGLFEETDLLAPAP